MTIDLTVIIVSALSSLREHILQLKDAFLALSNDAQFVWFFQWRSSISKTIFGGLFKSCLATEESLAVKRCVSGPVQWRATDSAFLAPTNGAL